MYYLCYMVKRQPYTKTGKPVMVTLGEQARGFVNRYAALHGLSHSAVITLALELFELEYRRHNDGEIHTTSGED